MTDFEDRLDRLRMNNDEFIWRLERALETPDEKAARLYIEAFYAHRTRGMITATKIVAGAIDASRITVQGPRRI